MPKLFNTSLLPAVVVDRHEREFETLAGERFLLMLAIPKAYSDYDLVYVGERGFEYVAQYVDPQRMIEDGVERIVPPQVFLDGTQAVIISRRACFKIAALMEAEKRTGKLELILFEDWVLLMYRDPPCFEAIVKWFEEISEPAMPKKSEDMAKLPNASEAGAGT